MTINDSERKCEHMDLLGSLFTFGMDIISFVFVSLIALTAGITAWMKGRNGLIWGGITFFLPWMIFFVFILPVKVPKFKSYLKDQPGFRGKNPVIASLMALSAIVAKADGHVSKGEVDIIRRYITANFRISPQELATYQEAFDYGKTHREEYSEFIKVIRTYHNNRNFILSVSYLLMTLGIKDGSQSMEEERLLKEIILELGLSEYEFISIKQFFVSGIAGGGFARGSWKQGFNGSNGFGGNWSGGYGYKTNGYGSRQKNIYNQTGMADEYAKILGVDKNDDLTTIKKAYRRLAKEYHPDKMASQGMPDDYMKFANEKIAKINEAYDYLKKMKEESPKQFV